MTTCGSELGGGKSNDCTSQRALQPMPPKRKRHSVERTDSSVASSEDASPLYLHYDVTGHAAMYRDLPTDVILSLIVGVATCLSARIAALRHSSASGNVRVFKDCIRVINTALSAVNSAVIDLAGLQMVLDMTLVNLSTGLDNASTPSRRSRRS